VEDEIRSDRTSASGAGSNPGPEPAVPSRPVASARRAIYLGAAAAPPSASSRCPVCLERIAPDLATCTECGEPLAGGPPSAGPASIPDDQPGDSFLKLHWRPIVTMGFMAALVCTGVALRSLAPGRFLNMPAPRAAGKSAAAPAPACATPCWTGEACEAGKCVWHPPNDVGHTAAAHEPTIGGPYALPKDVSDALPLDGERFAVALLTGISVRNTRTGGELSLVTDAPQSRGLYHVGPVVYATAPQRIYVVDAATTRLLKTIETGATVGQIVVGASGRRALASLPAAHSIAVLATEFHAEIERIQFGDDPVGPMGADDTGKRALTTTGQVPIPGLRDPSGQGGAVYAFDPSRLASAQDRVRASMDGNPVSVLMTPDGETSYVVLRAEDALVPLEWLPSGAVRQEARVPTCREPEQIELVRGGRRGLVRCNEGHAVEVFDLAKREQIRHVSFNARVADMAVSPDGKQAIVALPADGQGFVGIMDLESYAVKVLPLGAEPTRVRFSPDGSVALVLSDRAKVAWVIR
jgi:DNA-binding beta-propeller fold protein YncE